MLTLNTGGRPAKKNPTQLRFACHETANRSSVGDNPSRFLRQVNSLGARAVLYDAEITMEKDHEITGVERYALPSNSRAEACPR